MQKKVTILWEQTDSEGWGSAGSGRTPSWKKNPALFLSQDMNDTMWGGHCFNKLWRRTGESSDPALPTLHSEDWIISMWDLPPPVYYTEAQEDSVPSPSISGIFKDGDEPEWFSAHGERGLLSSDLFIEFFSINSFLLSFGEGAWDGCGGRAPNHSCFTCAFNNVVERSWPKRNLGSKIWVCTTPHPDACTERLKPPGPLLKSQVPLYTTHRRLCWCFWGSPNSPWPG